MADNPMADPSGPLSWRDVYKAVGDSEQRIVEAIRDAVKPINDRLSDHELRIRNLEVHGSVEAQAALAEVRALNIRIEAIEVAARLRDDTLDDRLNAYDNREKGILATLTFGQRLILVAGSVLGIVLTLLGLINAVKAATPA